jgi:peptidoglycan/LPS O-acetylase OafA/YrhL
MTDIPHKHLSEKLHRVEAIDALRGLAAVMVLLYHARGMFWVGFSETFQHYRWHPDFNALLGYLSMPLGYGSVGVTLFFVLSGYCIHRRGALLLAKNPKAKLDIGAFAIRRFWRIYPTYFAALVLTALVDTWLLARTGYRDPVQDDSIWAFGVSLLTLQGYLAHHFGSNGVFWTLAMEVHLYAAYPLLFYISRRFGAWRALLFTLGVAAVYIALNYSIGIEEHFPYRFQRGPVFLPYWFTWTTGFFFAEIQAGRVADFGRWTWRGLMVTGIFVGLGLTIIGANEAADVFWAIFFTGFLRWSVGPRGRLFWGGWLGVALAFVGVFSYSLYAVHAPLLEAIHALVGLAVGAKFAAIWPSFVAAAATIPCAWLFFHAVEWWSIRKPGERLPILALGRKHA